MSKSVVDTSKDDITITLGNEDCDNNYALVNSSKEAIDLIGAFRNYPNGSSEGICEFDSLPQLDLSLKRSHPSGFWNEYTEERRTLGHSHIQQDPSFRVKMFYQSNLENINFEQQHDPHSQNTNNAANQTIHNNNLSCSVF
jgi:hypothetical protein